MKTTLDKLPINKTGEILYVGVNPVIKKRLLDLGMINSTKIKALYKSPLGDPTAYLLRGSIIALRKDDTQKITVNIKEEQDGAN